MSSSTSASSLASVAGSQSPQSLEDFEQAARVGRAGPLPAASTNRSGRSHLKRLLELGRRTARRPRPRAARKSASSRRSSAAAGLRVVVVVLVEQFGVGALIVDVLVVVRGVEQAGILRADRQRQAVLDRMQEDVVAQDMALDRLQERLAAAFQPLEQVGAAEAHEPLAGARQVVRAAWPRPASAARAALAAT